MMCLTVLRSLTPSERMSLQNPVGSSCTNVRIRAFQVIVWNMLNLLKVRSIAGLVWKRAVGSVDQLSILFECTGHVRTSCRVYVLLWLLLLDDRRCVSIRWVGFRNCRWLSSCAGASAGAIRYSIGLAILSRLLCLVEGSKSPKQRHGSGVQHRTDISIEGKEDKPK
jgi:hypothetical protein